MTALRIALLIPLVIGPPAPDMVGVATWYGTPYIGREMRGGGIYTGTDFTCAVDDSQWEQLQNSQLLVCTQLGYERTQLWYDYYSPDLCRSYPEIPDRCVVVTVTDTGDSDAFREAGVVVDLSVVAFRALRPWGTEWDSDGVLPVRVWRIGG